MFNYNHSYEGKIETTKARGETRRADDEASARDVDRVLARETIATITKDEKSKGDSTMVEPAEQAREKILATLQEDIPEKYTAEGEHKSLINKERIGKGEILIEEEEYDNLVEINKGGEGEGARMWQQFVGTKEQENTAKVKPSPRLSVSTQV